MGIKNRIGIRYNRLIVIKFANQNWDGYTLWLCKCNCGNEIIVRGCDLQTNNTKSCECLQREISSKICKERKGTNNPNYVDTKIHPTSLKAIRELKEQIRKRDNYTCQNCEKTQEQNKKEISRKLDVHHIDRNDLNNSDNNMITLCHSCHTKIKAIIN